MNDTIMTNGFFIFRLGLNGLESQTYDKDYYINVERQYTDNIDLCNKLVEQRLTKNIYDIFDGKDFLQHVKDGYITDYDGVVADVFVNGYQSNLGLATDNLISQGFLVSEDVWLTLCEAYMIEVNWANK